MKAYRYSQIDIRWGGGGEDFDINITNLIAYIEMCTFITAID